MSHRPRKRFGQNFLRDPAIIASIIATIKPRPGQHLLEIGPGQGAITRELLRQGGALDAVELDRDLLQTLKAQCEPLGEFRLFNADALSFDYCALMDERRKLRVVGNLPYNISTPLLFHLLTQKQCIEDMHFMLQKEVVQRIAAVPGSKRWGRLSVMLQLDCDIQALFDIAPTAFHPPPRVDSSFVRLTPRKTPRYALDDREEFTNLVTQAFAHKRKTLSNNMKDLLNADQIRAAGIDPSIRAEQIDIEGFVRLANLARQSGGD